MYLPHGYRPSKRYPLLILLHGLGAHDTDWLKMGYVQAIFDEAIATGRAKPMIVVMPDGGNGYWADWPADGGPRRKRHRYRTLVEPDVRRWAEKRFKTNGRVAIGGVSMGGFGALSIAMRHPDRFAAAFSLSGALFRGPPTGRSVYLRAFGYPGLRQARFAFVNPIDLAQLGRADDLPLWLDCGADDLPKFTDGLKTLSAILRARGVEHVARLRPGRHHWDVWLAALTDVLPWVSRQLDTPPPGGLRPVRPIVVP